MQLSFRLDKRPCESHLALDGKKWSLADRSKTQSKYKVKREKPVQQAEQNSVETKRSRGTSSDQTCVPSHAKQNKPTSTNNSRNAPEPKHKPQNNLPPHWKNTGRQQRGISWSSITRTWDGGMWSHRWRLFFPSGMADDALRLGPYMSVSRWKELWSHRWRLISLMILVRRVSLHSKLPRSTSWLLEQSSFFLAHREMSQKTFAIIRKSCAHTCWKLPLPHSSRVKALPKTLWRGHKLPNNPQPSS